MGPASVPGLRERAQALARMAEAKAESVTAPTPANLLPLAGRVPRRPGGWMNGFRR